MKLSNFIVGIGRVVSYYPSLKQITKSTTATIFICQMLYWSDKTSKGDGWIFKTSEEIEDETGLTYNEQRTARKALVELKLLVEQRHRLDHNVAYKVNVKELNNQWTILHPKVDEEDEEELPEEVVTPEAIVEPVVEPVTPEVLPHPARRSDVVKKGDLLDATLFFMQSPALQKEKDMDAIREKFAVRLHVNLNKRWEDLVKHAYTQETNFNQPVDKFIDWWIVNGGSPIYWTPEKMQSVYPQAYIKTETVTEETFIKNIPVSNQDEELVSMPRELKLKN